MSPYTTFKHISMLAGAPQEEAVFATTQDILCIVNKQGYLIEWNGKMVEVTKYSSEELMGMKFLDLFPPEEADSVSKAVQSIMKKGKGEVKAYLSTKSGKQILYHIHGDKLKSKNKQIAGFVARCHEITAQNREKIEQGVATVIFETDAAIMITDAQGNIVRVNQAFQKVTGYHLSEVIGKNPRILKSDRHDKKFFAAMWVRLLRKGFWEGEIWDRRKNGEIYPKLMAITAVKDLRGKVNQYVAVFRDVSQFKMIEEEAHNLAFYDPLTKLPNRRLLDEYFRSSFSASERSRQYAAVLFLDMDNFKALNDTMGHSYGDLMLVDVAKRIRCNVRNVDNVARIGGDEFVILVKDLGNDAEEASTKIFMIAEKIRIALSLPFDINGYLYYSSTSIGMCLYYGKNHSVEVLLKNADFAMYQAKNGGRDRICFYDHALQQAAEARVSLVSDLRQAAVNQQLCLYYQIQLNEDHSPLGAEALIRWVHPEHGMISPSQFISIAEECGLILDIGRWVIDSACKQLARWSKKDSTSNLHLAINISGHQFKMPGFVELVESIVKANRINPLLLKLELTESVLLSNVDEVVVKMQALKALGLRLSIDDFGTGYSSLAYMRRLPINQIKIDQSFVRNITSDSHDASLVKIIIDMARTFKCDVIAEGVETKAQLNFLKQHGCSAYQGYLFSKPVPIEQFEKLLEVDL